MRTEVCAIDDFPDRADAATVREMHRTDAVASVAVSGDMPLHDLDLYADGLADRIAALRAGFLTGRVPGLQVLVAGQAANLAETGGSILRGFLIGLLGIYLVLSFQFRSYAEPVIVMLTIPLAMLGVIWGHWLTGFDLSMPSMMGAASLAGIVVNNAILLVEVTKERHAQGLSFAHAAGAAVRARFRPIVITVGTTVIGMVSLLSEPSLQAQMLKPLVVSVMFGMIASTVLVLLVLPAFYAILDDWGWRGRAGRRATGGQTAGKPAQSPNLAPMPP